MAIRVNVQCSDGNAWDELWELSPDGHWIIPQPVPEDLYAEQGEPIRDSKSVYAEHRGMAVWLAWEHLMRYGFVQGPIGNCEGIVRVERV